MTVNYLIWTFTKPSHVIALLAVLGVVVWPTKLGRRCRSAAVLLLVALGLLPIASYTIRPLETRFPPPVIAGEVDGIVVLAGSELVQLSDLYGHTQLNSHGERLTTFLRLAAEYPNARLIHSGSKESATAGALILGTGVDAGRLMLDDGARNTCESAANVYSMVDAQPGETWLLVTSAFHMPRAMACFRAIGWDVTPYPTDYRRGSDAFYFGLINNLADLDLAAHEWIGLLYYKWKGYTDELFPGPDEAELRNP